MISYDEWQKLKDKEQYGMWLDLNNKIEALEKRVGTLEINTGNY